MSGARTFNYDTIEFFKLDTTTLPRSYSDQAGAAASFGVLNGGIVEYQNLQEDTNPNGNIFLRLQDGSDGDHFIYSRVSEEAPFTASVDLTFDAAGLIDTDGVCYDGDGDSICDGTTPTPLSTDDDFAFGNIMGTSQRFGRLNIGTAVGSELLPLSVTFQAEYYDGTSFVVNTIDDCTAFSASDLSLSSAVASGSGPTIDITDASSCGGTGVATATITNNPFVAGIGDLSFTLAVPADGCTGYIDLTLDLSLGGLSFDWLQYDWDDDDDNEDGPYDDDPIGRVDFGIYEGPSSFIYIREPW